MKTHTLILPALAVLLLTVQPATAQGSLKHSARATTHGSQAAAHSAAGAAKLATGVAAIPLIAAGEVGQAAGASGKAMWEGSHQPLPISDETITAGPPPALPDASDNESPANLEKED